MRGSTILPAVTAVGTVTPDEVRWALLDAVAHDVRNPLTAITTCVSTLRHPDACVTADQAAELLTIIASETERMGRLVADLLDARRIRDVVVSCRRTTLDEVVAAAISSLGPRQGSVRVAIDGAPDVVADPPLLERVVANLVDNALRHVPAGTAVELEARSVGPRAQLRVIDRGPGIPRADRERIFRPFERRDPSGWGLGLAFAQVFVLAMRGTLSVEDTPMGGTTMVVELDAIEDHRDDAAVWRRAPRAAA